MDRETLPQRDMFPVTGSPLIAALRETQNPEGEAQLCDIEVPPLPRC